MESANCGKEEVKCADLTYGQKAVGLTFNPSGDSKVQKVKELYAEIIDIVMNNAYPVEGGKTTEMQALSTESIRQAQAAQMWAVKAITWKN